MDGEHDQPKENRDPDSEELNEEELDAVQGGTKAKVKEEAPDGLLAHELTHIRKKDS